MSLVQQIGNYARKVVWANTIWGVLYAYQNVPNFTFPVTALVRLIDLPEAEPAEVPLPLFILHGDTLDGAQGGLTSQSIYYRTPMRRTYAGSPPPQEFNYAGNHGAMAMNLTQLTKLIRRLNPDLKRVHFEVTFVVTPSNNNHIQFAATIVKKLKTLDVAVFGTGNAEYNDEAIILLREELPWTSPGIFDPDGENRNGCTGYFDITDIANPVIVLTAT